MTNLCCIGATRRRQIGENWGLARGVNRTTDWTLFANNSSFPVTLSVANKTNQCSIVLQVTPRRYLYFVCMEQNSQTLCFAWLDSTQSLKSFFKHISALDCALERMTKVHRSLGGCEDQPKDDDTYVEGLKAKCFTPACDIYVPIYRKKYYAFVR